MQKAANLPEEQQQAQQEQLIQEQLRIDDEQQRAKAEQDIQEEQERKLKFEQEKGQRLEELAVQLKEIQEKINYQLGLAATNPQKRSYSLLVQLRKREKEIQAQVKKTKMLSYQYPLSDSQTSKVVSNKDSALGCLAVLAVAIVIFFVATSGRNVDSSASLEKPSVVDKVSPTLVSYEVSDVSALAAADTLRVHKEFLAFATGGNNKDVPVKVIVDLDVNGETFEVANTSTLVTTTDIFVDNYRRPYELRNLTPEIDLDISFRTDDVFDRFDLDGTIRNLSAVQLDAVHLQLTLFDEDDAVIEMKETYATEGYNYYLPLKSGKQTDFSFYSFDVDLDDVAYYLIEYESIPSENQPQTK
jgi:hypothetical protein